MNILSIENARTDLLNFLENSSSRRLKLKKVSMFFELLVEHNSQSLIESYLIEFIPQYIDFLKGYTPFGITPSFTQNIINVSEKLIDLNELSEFKEQLSHLNKRMKFKLQSLVEILEGNEIVQEDPRVLFPVIEESEDIEESFVLGAIDSITIKIGKAKEKDKFIVVPSESERDKQLKQQIITSWQKAKAYSKKYVKKLQDYHEAIISFDQHLGIYRGESVGTALTIGFIEELLKQYNSQTVFKPIKGVAFTGGIKENGEVNQVSEEIVKRKVEVAFYSNCNTITIPKNDEAYALNKLEELKKEFPQRNLCLVGVKTLNEILLRRDLVEIKKQKIIVRTGKFVIKNWAGVLFAVLLTMFLTYFFALDFDDNPASLTTDGITLFVKNKNGKILWTRKAGVPKEASENQKILFKSSRIFDIDSDGRNEVLHIGGQDSTSPNLLTGSKLICYDNLGSPLWEYVFTDSVESEREVLKPFYGISMIDTFSLNGRRCLFLFSDNSDSFSSAIFRIDLETGERLLGTMWCSGHAVDAIIKDSDYHGRKDIFAIGLDNGYEEIVIWSFDIDTLTTSRLSRKEYIIKNYPLAKLKTYIRLPKTDYEHYTGLRLPGIAKGSFFDDIKEKKYRFHKYFSDPEREGHLWIKLDYNLKDFDFIVDNQFRVTRDSLVFHGKLNLPYTDTKEYVDLYKSKILYWKNGKWVKRDELD